MKKNALLTLLCLLGFLISNAQSTVIIGNGNFAQGAPVSRFFRYHASEMIYLQSEISTNGRIETIAFDKASGTDNNVINNVSIYMRHTTATTLSGGTTSTAGYTLVYSGNYTNNASTGWMAVTLTNPFTYNNTDNLQILIIKGNQAPLLAAQFPRYKSTETTPNYRFRSYSDDSNPWSETRTLNAYYDRPNVRLTFCTPSAFTINAQACDSYTLNNQTYTSSGSYTQVLVNTLGCDSVITLNLSINNSFTTLNETACNSYLFDGNTLTSSGTYTGVFTNSFGCDSTVTLNLSIGNNTSTLNETVCDSYVFDGNTLTVSDVYTATFTNALGCDSVVTLNLTVNTSNVVTVNETACDSYVFDGNTLTVSDIYTATFTNAFGCDSVVTLNLVINTSDAVTVNEIVCDSYVFDGNTLTLSDTYTAVFTNALGCDSTVTLNLTIANSATTLNETACESYVFDGNTLTVSDVYTATFTNALGCDSVVTLNLVINNGDVVPVNETACDSYVFDGNTLTVSDVYTAVFTNSLGCDSTVVLTLEIINSSATTLNETACVNYVFDGNTLTISDTYIATFTNSAGCDSVVTLNLNIVDIDTSVSVSGNTFTANEAGAVYEWINCDNNTPINNETNQSFVPVASGNYSVSITVGGCSAVSSCFNYTIVSIDTETDNSFSVFPNPTTGILTINHASTASSKVKLFNVTGQQQNILTQYNNQSTVLNISNLASGVYVLEASINDQVFRKRVIKE